MTWELSVVRRLTKTAAVWLKFWTDADGNNTGQQAGYYIGVYSALQILAVIWFAILIWYWPPPPRKLRE